MCSSDLLPASPPPPPRQMPGRKIAAIILVCMAFLVWLFLTVLGVPLEGLILATPLLVCAAICFAAKKRAGLWCAWAIYLTVELYLRWATGLTWRLTLRTFVFTPEENYTRLVIAWVQLLVLLLMFFFTFRSFRNIHLDLHSRRNRFLLAGGWVLLILLHLLKTGAIPSSTKIQQWISVWASVCSCVPEMSCFWLCSPPCLPPLSAHSENRETDLKGRPKGRPFFLTFPGKLVQYNQR